MEHYVWWKYFCMLIYCCFIFLFIIIVWFNNRITYHTQCNLCNLDRLKFKFEHIWSGTLLTSWTIRGHMQVLTQSLKRYISTKQRCILCCISSTSSTKTEWFIRFHFVATIDMHYIGIIIVILLCREAFYASENVHLCKSESLALSKYAFHILHVILSFIWWSFFTRYKKFEKKYTHKMNEQILLTTVYNLSTIYKFPGHNSLLIFLF